MLQSTRKRIAALVATPSKGNTGMRVVNDALVCWLDSLRLLGETDFFRFETPPPATLANERVCHGCVLDLDPARYAWLVVWGDFLIDRNWLAKACERAAAERGARPSEVRRHAEAAIFGGEAGSAEPVRLVVGQNFLVSDDGYDADAAYQARFARLAREARLFLLRDPISAARASVFARSPASPLPPLDAALLRPALRERSSLATVRAPAAKRGGFGLFFGRTHGGLRAKLASTLAAARGGAGRAYALSWLPGRVIPGWLRLAASPEPLALDGDVDDVVATLRGLSFVVTDTYHLALVCWSSGVPAICVGAGAQRFAHSTHDKKKELFFLSQRIERFHLFAEASFASAHAQARACVAEIAAHDPGPAVARAIAAQAEPVLRALDEALREESP
jgi:hypothetical protein